MAKNRELSVPAAAAVQDWHDDGAGAYLALRPDSEIAEALAANLVAGESISASDLVRVKTPSGGGKTWQYVDANGVEREEKSLVGILAAYVPVGTLWGGDQPAKGELPVLVTHDFVTARRVNDKIGTLDGELLELARVGDRLYDWTKLPWTQYGSGKDGHGKRAKESRLLFLLQPGETWPVLVTCGPGSLKSVTGWVKKFPVPHFRCEVELTLTRAVSNGGVDYSQIVGRTLRTLSREEGAVIQRLYTIPLSRVAAEVSATVGQDA
jgi:hypothetical protein